MVPRGGNPASLPRNTLSFSAAPPQSVEEVRLGNTAAIAYIATLTATLRDTQDQLKQSKARGTALTQRNNESAQASTLEQSHPCGREPSLSASLPDVRVFFRTVTLPISITSPGFTQKAWLCPSEDPATLFSLPDSANCSTL
ncbi:unnamed protein product [Haemonchus placei]|uniref:Uncharacterized protein n=1 Tax=Haemonchus placei TaxID=6290 RepID=A0A0N4WF34_HAEPC|nr:unnamed protein product [Haemonchus placei]